MSVLGGIVGSRYFPVDMAVHEWLDVRYRSSIIQADALSMLTFMCKFANINQTGPSFRSKYLVSKIKKLVITTCRPERASAKVSRPQYLLVPCHKTRMQSL